MTMSYATALHVWKHSGQNARRHRRRRIDYYPTPDALRVIEALVADGNTFCSAINKLVESAAFRNGSVLTIPLQNQ